MTYRDQNDALRARVGSLERELADARGELADARGAETPEGAPSNVFLGGPTQLEFERAFPGELDEECIGELISIVRSELGQIGRLDRLGGSTAWSSVLGGGGNTLVEVLIETRRGKTHLKVREGLGNLAGGLFGGVVGGAGGGGLGMIVPLAMLVGVPGAAVPFLAVGWIGAVYGGVRIAFGRLSRRRERRLGRLVLRLEAAAYDALDEGDAQSGELEGHPAEVEVHADGRKGQAKKLGAP